MIDDKLLAVWQRASGSYAHENHVTVPGWAYAYDLHIAMLAAAHGAEQERAKPKTYSVHTRAEDGTMTKQHVIQSFTDADSVVLVIEELK